ncbi:unnamed protein product [Larinioides sclopetarius]|uniref:Cuticle protein n=1 Tax=Larinioides sclopetarius TaxID=280406 RepID=A0AAV1YXQ1_9ARAC
MRTQIIAILLVAVVCCNANYLPGTYNLGGASYAGALGLGYAANPVAPYNAYAAAYNPAAGMKIYVVSSDLSNYVVVSDAAAPAAIPAAVPAAIPAAVPAASYAAVPAASYAAVPAASYAVVDPSPVVKDTVSRYVAPLRTYGNIAYVVKK